MIPSPISSHKRGASISIQKKKNGALYKLYVTMASRRMNALVDQLQRMKQALGQPTTREWRKALAKMASKINPEPSIKYTSLEVNDLPVLKARGANGKPDGMLLHFHGGGFIGGSMENARGFIGRLCNATNSIVCSVNYRLAPEHPYPAALVDARIAWEHFSREMGEPERMILLGESAGAYLALNTVIDARNAGKLLPGGIILISPWIDLAINGGSTAVMDGDDPMLSRKLLEHASREFLGNGTKPIPLLERNLGKLPPMLIVVGEREILLNDAVALEREASKAGTRVKLRSWPGCPHAFPLFNPSIPEVRQATHEITTFTNRILTQATSNPR